MVDTEYLSQAIRDLYTIIDQLEGECCEHPCHFSLDGNLLGSIGEVYAAKRYNLELFTAANKTHDAKTLDGTGRLVQIKVTQSRTRKKVVGLSHEPKYLLVFVVDENGVFEEVYNGPGKEIWNLVRDRPNKPSNGQYQISLSKLREINETVEQEDRIETVSV